MNLIEEVAKTTGLTVEQVRLTVEDLEETSPETVEELEAWGDGDDSGVWVRSLLRFYALGYSQANADLAEEISQALEDRQAGRFVVLPAFSR